MGERKPLIICSKCKMVVITNEIGDAIQHYSQYDSSRKNHCAGSGLPGTIYQ